MRKKNFIPVYLVFLLIILLAAACNLPTAMEGQVPTDTEEAPPATLPDQQETTQPEAEETEQPPQDEPAPTETQSLPTETVAHSTYPGQPGASVWLTDISSKVYGPDGYTVGDSFSTQFFERPLTSQEMNYQPYLDIVRAELSVTSPYVYVTIFLEEEPPQGAAAHYGVEIDSDQDGRGDWLVYAQVPDAADWTSAGVMVYKDSDNDVGGPTPLYAEGPQSSLNGYDELLFNQGYDTTDPDMAWVRRAPGQSKRIQIAFKYSVIGSADTFLWGAWSDEGPVEPAWFDYNDHFSESEAGSPLSNSPNFPLNELALLDNTCRWAYGFNPTGDEPGICEVIQPTATPTITPTITPKPLFSLGGVVFEDQNADGIRNGGEAGMPGYTVTLGSGACSSAGAGTTVTGTDGSYSFSGLTAGTYCVTVDISLSGSCAGWHSLTGKQQTVVLNSNNFGINFGFFYVIC